MSVQERLKEISERLLKAEDVDDWGKHSFDFTIEKQSIKNNGVSKLWYGDGDLCAEIHDNLGLGVNGDAIAELFGNAKKDIRYLLDLLAKHGIST